MSGWKNARLCDGLLKSNHQSNSPFFAGYFAKLCLCDALEVRLCGPLSFLTLLDDIPPASGFQPRGLRSVSKGTALAHPPVA